MNLESLRVYVIWSGGEIELWILVIKDIYDDTNPVKFRKHGFVSESAAFRQGKHEIRRLAKQRT